MHAPQRQRQQLVEQYKETQESLRALAKRYGINPKTVAKWKKRTLELVQSFCSRSAKKAKWMNCKLVLSLHSQFFHSLLFGS